MFKDTNCIRKGYHPRCTLSFGITPSVVNPNLSPFHHNLFTFRVTKVRVYRTIQVEGVYLDLKFQIISFGDVGRMHSQQVRTL